MEFITVSDCVRLQPFFRTYISIWNLPVCCAFAYAHLAITFRYLHSNEHMVMCVRACERVIEHACVCVILVFAIINYVIFTRTCARTKERESEGGRNGERERELVLICDAND